MQEIDPVSQAMHDYVRLCSHLVCILLVIISCTICNHYTQTLHATFDNDSSNKQYTFGRRQCTVIGELQSFDLDYVMYMYICPLFFEWLRPPYLAPRRPRLSISTCFSSPQLAHSSSIISTMVRRNFALVSKSLTFETLILESFEWLRWRIRRWVWWWRRGIRQSWWWELGGIRRPNE